MEDKISSAEFQSKESFKLPEGAEILRKEYRLTIEEIENGYIVNKYYDITYESMQGHKEYAHFSKKYYSKDNPMSLKIKDKDIPLEDKLG